MSDPKFEKCVIFQAQNQYFLTFLKICSLDEQVKVTVLDKENSYYCAENGVNGSFWGPTSTLSKYSKNLFIKFLQNVPDDSH